MIILIDQPLTNDHQDQGPTGSRCPVSGVIKDRTSGYKYVCLQELLEKLPAVKEGKILADKMIDNCGTPPGDDGYDDGDDGDV